MESIDTKSGKNNEQIPKDALHPKTERCTSQDDPRMGMGVGRSVIRMLFDRNLPPRASHPHMRRMSRSLSRIASDAQPAAAVEGKASAQVRTPQMRRLRRCLVQVVPIELVARLYGPRGSDRPRSTRMQPRVRRVRVARVIEARDRREE